MKKVFILIGIVLTFSGLFGQPVITTIMDGTCTGGTPKMLEIYASGTVDFSLYSLENQTNANTTWGNPTDLSPLGTVTNAFVYVYYDSSYDNFLTEFPSATTNMESSVMNLNGDDRIRLILSSNSSIIDQYGVTDVDGTGSTWEWMDSYAKRNNGTGPDAGFTEANWTIAGANTLDGLCGSLETSIGGIGTYTPPSSNDQTSTVTAPGTQLTAGSISSIGTDSVPVMRFDITDAASGDGLPTNVTGIYFVAGPNNTLDFTQNLNGGGVYDLTNGAVIPVTGQPTVNADNVYLPISLSIPDGGTVSIEAYVKVNNANAPDGGILQFQINSASHGFTADASGSDFEDPFAGGDIVGNDFTVDVVATQFTFLTQPTDVNINPDVITPAVRVGTTDAGGNVDVDYPQTLISLIFSGTGSMYGTSGITTGNGISTYYDLSFATAQTGVHLTAHDGNGTTTFSDVNSTDFNINPVGGGADCANAVSIDVGTHHALHSDVGLNQWYVYHATSTGMITAENCSSGSSSDTYVQIIEGSCTGTNWDENDNYCNPLSHLNFFVTAGNDYYIGWGTYDDPGNEYDWTLSFSPTYNIINAYTISNTELLLQYESALSSVDPADYTLTATGQTTVNFSTATIDGTDPTIVHLTASANFDVNLIRDNINDAANNSTLQFYAGVLPVMYMNTANDPDTVMQGYNVTLRGVVTANDNYNQVWIQDSNNPMSGIVIYSSSFDALVSVNDTITLTGQKVFSYGMTEIVNPVLINSVGGGTPVAANIDASDLDYYASENDANAEPWEGQLVTVSGIVIDSLNTSHYEYFGHACDGTVICFDDDVDYHYGSGFALTTGSMYDITGVVTYSYSHYKINPRGTSDATEIVRDMTSVVEDPANQITDATIDATIPVDSLNAIEVFKFKVTDEGTDGLPTALSQITIYTGPNNTIDLTTDEIAGGWLDFGDAANPIEISAEPTVTSNQVTFPVDPGTAMIGNGTSREVILHLWFDPAFIVDESVLQIMVQADPHGFVAECMNSQFAPTFTSDVVGGSLTLDTNIGIENINGNSIFIYPNPSGGIFNINVSDNYKLEVTDITGRVLKTEKLTGITTIKLNTSGVYFLKFSNNKGYYTQKIIVK